MNIALSPDLEAFVSSKVKSGKYPTPFDVIQESLRLLRERDEEQQRTIEELRKDLAVGIEQADRGEVAPFRPVETLNRMRQQKNVQH